MRHTILLLCCWLLSTSIHAQQPYKSVTFCKADWLVIPQKFALNFTHEEVETELRKTDTIQHRWIGYYAEDSSKIAVVSTIYEKANKKQQRHGIKTSGWLFEFYFNDTITKKYSCYKQQMKRSVYYENGKKRVYSEFYPDGQVSLTGKLDANEQRDGKWKYYDEKGGLTKTVKYKNGVIED